MTHVDDATVDLPVRRIPLAFHAPQVAGSLPRQPTVRTTLDLPLQVALERLASESLQSLPSQASTAILIADAASREILAVYPGAWRDQPRSGALDLTVASRSPGSALKPFIYAIAFADGTIAPETIMTDLPRHFGGYAPENFDRGFAGSLTAADALRRSLNLPAVALLDQIGPLRFTATLRSAGVTLRLPHGADPSLPLALGGAGITLRQATSLYAALATDGASGPLRLLRDAPVQHTNFLSALAARQVADVLTRPLPGFAAGGIAWKTGTSWGGRDAWAFGFDTRHVIGVWIGRPDGTPLPAATGASLALPLLGHVFDLLPPAPRPMPPGPAQQRATDQTATDGLRLLFPPPEAVLSADGPVTIRAMGGRRPLIFLIDGAPLASDRIRREVTWRPNGPGFYRVSVLDAGGAVARVGVRVADEAPH
jgi:penicillin-binding protein 1C